MSALPRRAAGEAAEQRPVGVAALGELLAIERTAYEFPWTRGNFVDSIAAGYLVEGLFGARDGALRAYYVAMAGVDEMHLLNLTVAPAWQHRGLARRLLDDLVRRCRERAARQLWLEVRPSNERARALYERYGFRLLGLRRGYYPAAGGQREDAQVMGLRIAGPEGDDGLD